MGSALEVLSRKHSVSANTMILRRVVILFRHEQGFLQLDSILSNSIFSMETILIELNLREIATIVCIIELRWFDRWQELNLIWEIYFWEAII